MLRIISSLLRESIPETAFAQSASQKSAKSWDKNVGGSPGSHALAKKKNMHRFTGFLKKNAELLIRLAHALLEQFIGSYRH